MRHGTNVIDELRDQLRSGDIDGDDVVYALWPYDGPHSTDTVRSALLAASALVRYANNATSYPGRWGYAPQTYRALGGLNGAVGGLSQLLEQLGARCGELAEDDTVRSDQYSSIDPQAASAGRHSADVAGQRVRQARETVMQLHAQLTVAHGHLSHIGHQFPEPDADADAE